MRNEFTHAHTHALQPAPAIALLWGCPLLSKGTRKRSGDTSSEDVWQLLPSWLLAIRFDFSQRGGEEASGRALILILGHTMPHPGGAGQAGGAQQAEHKRGDARHGRDVEHGGGVRMLAILAADRHSRLQLRTNQQATNQQPACEEENNEVHGLTWRRQCSGEGFAKQTAKEDDADHKTWRAGPAVSKGLARVA